MRNRHTITRWLAGLCLLLLASSAFAQSTAQLDGNRLTHDTYVRGAGQAAVTVSGTFTGTLTFKVKHQGQDPVAVDCFSPASPSTAVNVTTAPGSWSCPVGSYTWFEVQFSAYTSGTATIVADTSTSGGTTVAGAAGGGSFDGVLLDAPGGDAVTDTANDAIRVSDGGGTLTVDGTVTANAGTNLNTSALLTTAAFQTAFGSGSVVSADPCEGGTKIVVPISQIASTQLLSGTASNRTYVCAFMVTQPSASTQTFALVSGTGTTCGTSVGAMIGGTTAATGMQLPLAFGAGVATIAKSDTDADNVCLLQSGTDRLAGVLTYVVAP